MAITNLTYKNAEFSLSYELLNLDKEPILLIMHGWGANKELMKSAFKDKFKAYKHLYIDLCGFGKSSAPLALTSFDYAAILKLFLAEKKLLPSIMMGHSFGGKICALLSSSDLNSLLSAKSSENAPLNLENLPCVSSNLRALIFLSSAGILKSKSLKVRLKIKLTKTLQRLGLKGFGKFFASKDAHNLSPLMYETFKNVVDEDFSEIFSQIHTPSYLFWGESDTATPLASGKKMHALIQNSQFYPLKGDHFFFLDPKNADFIDRQFDTKNKV